MIKITHTFPRRALFNLYSEINRKIVGNELRKIEKITSGEKAVPFVCRLSGNNKIDFLNVEGMPMIKEDIFKTKLYLW